MTFTCNLGITAQQAMTEVALDRTQPTALCCDGSAAERSVAREQFVSRQDVNERYEGDDRRDRPGDLRYAA